MGKGKHATARPTSLAGRSPGIERQGRPGRDWFDRSQSAVIWAAVFWFA